MGQRSKSTTKLERVKARAHDAMAAASNAEEPHIALTVMAAALGAILTICQERE